MESSSVTSPGDSTTSQVREISVVDTLGKRDVLTCFPSPSHPGWDPRGVSNSLPRIDCFASAAEEKAFWNGTIPYNGLEAKGNFTNQADLDAFYAQAGEVDSLLVQLGERCTKMSGDNLKYVGTAAAVRDMVAMTDFLDGAGTPVNYWGFSYGTVIGAYFVNSACFIYGRSVLHILMDLRLAQCSLTGSDDSVTDDDSNDYVETSTDRWFRLLSNSHRRSGQSRAMG